MGVVCLFLLLFTSVMAVDEFVPVVGWWNWMKGIGCWDGLSGLVGWLM